MTRKKIEKGRKKNRGDSGKWGDWEGRRIGETVESGEKVEGEGRRERGGKRRGVT